MTLVSEREDRVEAAVSGLSILLAVHGDLSSALRGGSPSRPSRGSALGSRGSYGKASMGKSYGKPREGSTGPVVTTVHVPLCPLPQ